MRKLPKWGVDKFPSLEPVTYTLVWEPKSQNLLEVLSIDGITEPVTAVQVTDVTVQFSKEIDPSTFSWEDMSLTFQGGADIMNNSVVITQLDTATFSVDISSLTTGNGFYNLTVQAAGVEDIYGISGETGKQLTWSQFLTVPKVQAFLGLPEGNIATTFDTRWVQFNLPIDLATISGESFYLLKDEVQLEAKVNLDSVSEDQMLFYLSWMRSMLPLYIWPLMNSYKVLMLHP